MEEKILDYTLEALIGEGSFSKVYKAKKGGKYFAIKLLTPPAPKGSLRGMGDNDLFFTSIRYEFWVLKDLFHPHIVHVHDFGSLNDGRIYLIEDYLEGIPLNSFAVSRSFNECREVFVHFIKALKELERWNLVHGDIKPDNMMVVGTPQGPCGILLDFGLARPVHHDSPFQHAGTPATMAPEVILKLPSDSRSDLYSLGVSFYTALTGTNPFEGKDIHQTTLNHLHQKAKPIGLLRNDIPPVWSNLIMSCLAKNPADRPSSTSKVLSMIGEDSFLLTPTPFIGRKKELEKGERVKEFFKKEERAAITVNGPVGIGVSRFLKEIFYQLIGSDPHLRDKVSLVEGGSIPKTSILLLDRMESSSGYQIISITLSPFTHDELNQWFREIFGLKNIPGSFLDQVMVLTGGNPRLVWEILTHLNQEKCLADPTGKVTATTLSLIKWNEIFDETSKKNFLEDFELLLNDARKKIRERNLPENNPLWKSLESSVEAEENQIHRLKKRALFLALKGEALIDEGKLIKARENLNSALEIFKQNPLCEIDKIRTQNFLAYILLRQGKPQEAVKDFETIQEEVEKKCPENEKRKITNLDLGLAYLQAGDYQKAIKRLQEEINFHNQGIKDGEEGAFIRKVSCLYNMAQAYAALKDYPQAEDCYQQTLKQARKACDPPFILRALNGLGNVFQVSQKWREALKTYGEALEVALAIKDYVAAAVTTQNRGALSSQHGLYQEAINDLKDSLKYIQKIVTHYAFEKTLECRCHVELGEIYTLLGRFDKAHDSINRAWHKAEGDDDLIDFRFWILIARCKVLGKENNQESLEENLSLLNYYANTEEKKKKLEEYSLILRQAQDVQSVEHGKLAPKGPLFGVEPCDPNHLLERFIQINKDLVGDFSLDELLKRILGHAIELSGAELGVILLADKQGELKPKFSLNAELNIDLCDISLSIAKQVVTTGKPVSSSDAMEDISLNQYASVIALNLRSILGLPLTFKGKVLGVLYLSHRYQPHLFSPSLIDTLRAFSNQAGLALTQHELLDYYRSTQELLKNELDQTRVELVVAHEKIRSLPKKFMEGPFKTRSKMVMELLDQVDRIVNSNITIVIQGETGTGKEVLARYVHQNSTRKDRPFVAINCGALPSQLIESELFGHAKGAFTGAEKDKIGLIEASHQGTLFLDEIGDLPLEAQGKLLRVLQEKEVLRLGDTRPRPVGIRLITASHKSLKILLAEKKFREDLYYRLNGLEVIIPPLRERPEDIVFLAEHFLVNYLQETKKKYPEKIAATVLKCLYRYSWPGNIRELKNFMETASAFCETKILKLESLPQYWQDRLTIISGTKNKKQETLSQNLGWYFPDKTWQEHELFIYKSALQTFNFDILRTANSLGVGVATIYKWVRENRLKESQEEWKGEILPYKEGTKLAEIKKTVFLSVAKKFPGHPYQAARELGVAPMTFLQWSREQK